MSKSRFHPRGRSTASLVISTGALFVALSGGAVAAVVIPSNSVGSSQLKSGAVVSSKIGKGAVHATNIDENEVQARVTGTCAPLSGVTGVSATGKVTCYRAISAAVVTPGSTVTVPGPSTAASLIADEPLPTPSAYVVDADPYIQVTGTPAAAQQVLVTCELAASGATPQTETATVDLFPSIKQGDADLHLSIDVPAASTENQAAVACAANYTGTTAPQIVVSTPITAIQTLHNTAYSSSPVTTAPVTVATPTTTTATTP